MRRRIGFQKLLIGFVFVGLVVLKLDLVADDQQSHTP
jgi:hypothetical protein